MPLMFSSLTSLHSYSIFPDWILSGMCTWPKASRLTPVAKGERGLEDVLTHRVQLLGTGRNFFISTITRLNYSPSLARCVIGIGTNKQVINVHNTGVFSTNSQDVLGVSPCTHEEADTRILLRLEDAVRRGNSRVSISTVDTDVVVLAVSSSHGLNISELWIDFGAGKTSDSLLAMKLPERRILIDVSLYPPFETK